MPYIAPSRRALVCVPEAPTQGVNEPLNAGELTYQLTVMIEDYRHLHGDKYQTFAEIVGALECAKLEAYRRVIAPYEDTKLAANGDCYGAPKASA